MLPEMEAHSEAGRAVRQESPGPLYSFVPAHGASRARTLAEHVSRALSQRFEAEDPGRSVLLADFEPEGYSVWRAPRAPRRLDGHTWGALVFEGNGYDVLDAREVHPRQLRPVFDYARDHYSVVCADLSGAKEESALEVLRASDAIFLVSGADWPSLEMVREKADWMRGIDLGDQCGLLLWTAPQGATAAQAEDFTGLPVCSLVDGDEQLERLAAWLAAQHLKAASQVAA